MKHSEKELVAALDRMVTIREIGIQSGNPSVIVELQTKGMSKELIRYVIEDYLEGAMSAAQSAKKYYVDQIAARILEEIEAIKVEGSKKQDGHLTMGRLSAEHSEKVNWLIEEIEQELNMDFETEVLKADGLVLVDFYADWCGPCKAAVPTLDELAKENAAKLAIVKVNVDDHSDIASQYGIKSIPALVFFKDGVEVKRTKFAGKVGLQSIIDELV